MQNIKGAIFDMDGTLLDSMPVWKRLTQNYLKQFDLHITDQDFAACEGFSQPQVADYFLARHPELPLTREQMLDGMDELITSRYETIAKPKPGVIEFLERMRRKGVKNGDRDADRAPPRGKGPPRPRHDAVFLVHAYDRGCGRAQI